MKRLKTCSALICLIVFPAMAGIQETPWLQWTLLPDEIMDEIIGEASGETAWNTVVETGGYNKDRRPEEYAGTFYEAQYIYDQLILYGLPGSEIARFPAWGEMFGVGRTTWDGIKGELWEVSPERRKLASYQDLRAMLISGSTDADVKAKLVWVGQGTKEEIERIDVDEKIVVTEGSPHRVHRTACEENGAVGLIAISTSRPYLDSLQIPWTNLQGRSNRDQERKPPKFGFYLPFREGYFLKRRLQSGEEITVHAQVKTQMLPYELQVPTCHIPGTDADAGEIILSAHIFEGYTKQGANDNKSGGATILEVVRILHTLIGEGRIPRPRRTIRFIWVPEFTGTIPWINENREIVDKALCNINMDMVGEWLIKNKAYAVLSRTSYGNPHYVNDVMENYYRFMGESNRDQWPTGIPRRIVAPSGADEPFYYFVEEHTGGSDHEAFNDWSVRVPGVSMNVWPDQWYHTSGDRPDKADPTMLRRMAIIGAAGAYTMACADEEMAIKIAGEITSNATRRIGHKLVVGLELLNKASADTLAKNYRMAVIRLEAAARNEKDTLSTVPELAENSTRVSEYVAKMRDAVDSICDAGLSVLETHMQAVAQNLETQPVAMALSDLEREASVIVYKTTSKLRELGAFASGRAIDGVPQEEAEKYPVPRGSIADTRELQILVDGRRSALDINRMLDAQHERESGLQAVINYLKILEIAGLIER